ncbi:MAG: hypothetical protein HYX53_09175 [Chloroflexi bacterium]|nr:hypothetical protein [Chloroflexota bacterium]
MTSRMHGSEDALAALTCKPGSDGHVLIGGLGMGYTLRAALGILGPGASVTVAELVPEVVEWNRSWIGALAGNPLDDPRAVLHQGDVAGVIRGGAARFDAILLDVDNGPDALTQAGNRWLYSGSGLAACYEALRPGGMYGLWSVGGDAPGFDRRLARAGFKPEVRRVRAREGGGLTQVIYLGKRPRRERLSAPAGVRAPAGR